MFGILVTFMVFVLLYLIAVRVKLLILKIKGADCEKAKERYNTAAIIFAVPFALTMIISIFSIIRGRTVFQCERIQQNIS